MLFRSPANGSRRRLRPTPGAAGALRSSSDQMPLRFGQPQDLTWNHRQSLKEVLRHVLFRTGNERVLLNHKRRRGLIGDHIANRKRVVEGKRVSVQADIGGRRSTK